MRFVFDFCINFSVCSILSYLICYCVVFQFLIYIAYGFSCFWLVLVCMFGSAVTRIDFDRILEPEATISSFKFK
jgi:hypothetical protein